MTTTGFPTDIVEITYTRDGEGPGEWMHAVAYPNDQVWTISIRIPAGDTDGTATRRKLGLAIMTGVQQANARPCDTKGCDRKAFNHGDVRVGGEFRHVNVCEPCKNAIGASAIAGPMSVLLMPFFAFAEYDA